jgi:hypothetical protein
MRRREFIALLGGAGRTSRALVNYVENLVAFIAMDLGQRSYRIAPPGRPLVIALPAAE